MKKSGRTFLLILVLICSSMDLFGQASLDNKIRRLISLTSQQSNFELVLDRIVGIQKTNSSILYSKEYWELFKSMFWNSFQSKGIDDMIPLYRQTFSEKEIDQILSFYESSVGKKMIQSLPKFLDHSMQIGETIGNDVSEAALDSLQLIMKERFEFEHTGCKFAKSGTFEFQQNGRKYSVERTIGSQKEITDTYTNDLEVAWLNDCKYKLTLISTTDVNTSLNEFPVLIFNIISDSETGYTYVGKPEDIEFFFQGYFVKKK